MEFRVHEVKEPYREVQGGHVNPRTYWWWQLVKVDGERVAAGPQNFDTEAAARSNIASAKKAMKGAMRCKVVTVHAASD